MDSSLAISRRKREILLRAKKERKVKEMRAELPVLSRDDIRKLRLPYYEAVIQELSDSGFTSSVHFLRQLINFQEDIRTKFGPDTFIGSRPPLRDSKCNIDLLSKYLKNAEIAYLAGNIKKECDEMLKLAWHYIEGSDDWWWVAEQVIQACVFIGHEYKDDLGEREALARYIGGLFYMFKEIDTNLARDHLNAARKLSRKKPWNAKSLLQRPQKRVFIEVCTLLTDLLLEKAKKCMFTNTPDAIALCDLSGKYSKEACYKEGEAEALRHKGMCLMLIGELTDAALCFYKVLKIQTGPFTEENMEKICEARINLALAYFKTGRSADALLELHNSAFAGEGSNLLFYVGQAHRYLGEHYLAEGDTEKAIPLLVKAINIFDSINDIKNIDQARIFAAIATGQQMMSQFTRLMVRIGRAGCENRFYLNKLLMWKNTREVFWSDSDQSITIRESVEDILTRSFQLSWESRDTIHAPENAVERMSDEVEILASDSKLSLGSASDLLDKKST